MTTKEFIIRLHEMGYCFQFEDFEDGAVMLYITTEEDTICSIRCDKVNQINTIWGGTEISNKLAKLMYVYAKTPVDQRGEISAINSSRYYSSNDQLPF